MPEEVISTLAARIADRGMSFREAAAAIGVGEDSLRRHLGGEYARSDSFAKYRLWLSGGSSNGERQLSRIDPAPAASVPPALQAVVLPEPRTPKTPLRVVDLFSGCGGLSLGFELFRERSFFSTVLAIDIEQPMVDTFNVNHRHDGEKSIAVRVDISDFYNESEVRGYYLLHMADVTADDTLRHELGKITPVALPEIVDRIQAIDDDFVSRYQQFQGSSAFQEVYAGLDGRTLGQTSVKSFHDSLRLPHPSHRDVDPAPMIWAGRTGPASLPSDLPKSVETSWKNLAAQVRLELERRWIREVELLTSKSGGSGRGQLASSAGRIGRFLRFLGQLPELKEIWLDWRCQRDALRFLYFDDPDVSARLLDLYARRGQVSVVVGGPPCQGFSRIGRGKIRSLREDSVHAHYDAESGDVRNRLFEKYVLFVGALAPEVFLFENVAHFKTSLKTPAGSFLATEVLGEAVENLSGDGLEYVLSSQTLVASRFGVPQRRERFFMAGVRKDVATRVGGQLDPSQSAAWLLGLPAKPEVPLRAALDDLPGPLWVRGPGAGSGLDRRVEGLPSRGPDPETPEGVFRAWIRQHANENENGTSYSVDGHVARDHRKDDRDFFALMGPGKRWMDYRCDTSSTLTRLRSALACLADLLENGDTDGRDTKGIDREEVRELIRLSDGSLSLRLLLETIKPQPGELEHHLLKDTYLKKRDGNHGDWLSRLDAEAPSKTIVTHMGKDTYAYVHPWEDRSLSVREAARIQSFPDWFTFAPLGLVDAFRVIGNAVPPLLSAQLADRVAQVLGFPVASNESSSGTVGGEGDETVFSRRSGA